MTAVEVETTWEIACRVDQIARESGVAVWVHGRAVAVFRDHEGNVYALSNLDPKTGASVLSRGIVGTKGGEPYVASPLHKQPYRLRDGVCLDPSVEPTLAATPYAVRVEDGVIWVGTT